MAQNIAFEWFRKSVYIGSPTDLSLTKYIIQDVCDFIFTIEFKPDFYTDVPIFPRFGVIKPCIKSPRF